MRTKIKKILEFSKFWGKYLLAGDQKQSVVRRCIQYVLTHTFTASQGKYGVNSCAKVRKIKQTANKKSENFFVFALLRG